jgi:peptidoglycan/xylan/chitin deacetylase (PgdA/CDA1 family)
MDPDAGAWLKRSHISKIALIALLFTACYFYKDRKLLKKTSLANTPNKSAPAATDTPVPKKPVVQKKRKKRIYLTFDDGPNKGTQNVVNIINDEQVPATLFIIGEHVFGSRLQANMYDSVLASPYIEVANHSYTHAHNRFAKFYQEADSVVNDFRRCADSLSLSSNIVRTPGRNIWRLHKIEKTDIKESGRAADSLQQNGFLVVGWDLEWHYNDQLQAIQSPEKLAEQVDSMFARKLTQSGDHLVLLAHDQVYAKAHDSSQLRKFVSTIKQKGEYEFAFISTYPGIEKIPQADSLVATKY